MFSMSDSALARIGISRVDGRLPAILLALALGLFVVVLIRTAWVCDDAYISFRSIDNFVSGYGLRWNVNERVQVYTHPLWVFLISTAFFFTREAYFTSIFISIAVSVAALAILGFRIARNATLGLLAITILLFSRAFVEYSTSGLENPLTHLLLAGFMLVLFNRATNERTLLLMSLVAGLGAVNRMDSVVIFAPAILLLWFSIPTRKATHAILLGCLPFVAWEFFSVAYYGFAFPNTAYAKLGSGMELRQLIPQGFYYLQNSWVRDPLTLGTISLAVVAACVRRDTRCIALMIGSVLYVFYLIRVGGDFMSGRMLTPPLFVSVATLARLEMKNQLPIVVPSILVAILVGCCTPAIPILSNRSFGDRKHEIKDTNGIGDARRFYYKGTGLLRFEPGVEMPVHNFAQIGRRWRAEDRQLTKTHGSVGLRGFFAGPKIHMIDPFALTDPLLARIPAYYKPDWRIGHFERMIPHGYEKSVLGDENNLEDADLAEFYDHLKLITRGPIWSGERWRSLIAMNLGQFDHLVRADLYKFKNLRRVGAEQLASASAMPTRLSAPGVVRLWEYDTLHVQFRSLQRSAEVELSTYHTGTYQLMFMNANDIVATLDYEPSHRDGFAAINLPVPETAMEAGYTAIRIIPFGGQGKFGLAHLRLR